MMKQVLVAIVFSSLAAWSADKVQGGMDPQMQEMMKKYQAAATPGEQHKMLSEMAGSWKYVSKMWEKPDAQPQESKGKTQFKKILGGRWIQQEFKGMAMGQPFEGLGLLGYDNVKGKFESVWMDTMSTGAMRGEGTLDASTNTIKETGTSSCPISADKTQEFRSDWQLVDKKKMVFSLYGKGPTDGPEFKMMEITYTR
jgi:hypothetical protein